MLTPFCPVFVFKNNDIRQILCVIITKQNSSRSKYKAPGFTDSLRRKVDSNGEEDRK